MRRREFIAFIGAVSMLPRAARSQQSTKVYRIARLHPLWPVAELTERSSNQYWRELSMKFAGSATSKKEPGNRALFRRGTCRDLL